MEEEETRVQQFFLCNNRPLFVQNGHQAWGYCLIQRPLNATGRVGKEALLRSLIFPSLHCKRQIMDLLNLTWRRKLLRDTRKKALKNCTIHSSIIHSNIIILFFTNKYSCIECNIILNTTVFR